MSTAFGRFARAFLLIGGIAVAGASFGMLPTGPNGGVSVAFAVPAMDNANDNDGDGNDDPTDDDSEDRILRGQVVELWDNLNPPEILVATTRESVWARLYNDQLQRTGVKVGDHVRLQGEYNHGVFDTYEVDVQTRCCPGPNNDNND